MLPVNVRYHAVVGMVSATVWWDIRCIGKNAETVRKHGAQGRRVMVRSQRVEPETYEKDDKTFIKIVAYDASVTFVDKREEARGIEDDKVGGQP